MGSSLLQFWFFRWSLGATLCRLPESMSILALISLGAHLQTYSFGALLVGVYTLSSALAAGPMGRLFDTTVHPRRTLVIVGVTGWILHCAVAAAQLFATHHLLILGLTFVAAVVPAGLPGQARAILSHSDIDSATKRRAFIVDAIVTELTWIMGPIIVALAQFVAGPSLSVLIMAASFLGVCGVFGPLQERIRTTSTVGLSREQYRAWDLFRLRSLWPAFTQSYGLGLVEAGFFATVPLLVAHSGLSPVWDGLFLGEVAFASALGGLLFARYDARYRTNYTVVMTVGIIFLCVFFGIPIFSPIPWVLGIGSFLGGMSIAPINSARALSVEKNAPAVLHAQGFSTLYSLYGVGSATSSALLAVLTPFTHAAWAFLIVSLASVLLGAGFSKSFRLPH